MKIKQAGGLAAAIAVLGWTSIAQADHLCVAEAALIQDAAKDIACANSEYSITGAEWDAPAIWQWKGKKGDGCKIHLSISNQLFVPHGTPPKGNGKNKSGSKDEADYGKGAAAALLDHKFEDALLHLQNIVDTIDSAARLNPDFGEVDGKDAAFYADGIRTFAANMKLAIYNPDTGTGCSVE